MLEIKPAPLALLHFEPLGQSATAAEDSTGGGALPCSHPAAAR